MSSAPNDFLMWLSTLKSDDLAGVIIVVAVAGVAAVAIVCTTIYKVHKTRADDSLKRELLDRGLTADEIAMVISAKSAKCSIRRSARS